MNETFNERYINSTRQAPERQMLKKSGTQALTQPKRQAPAALLDETDLIECNTMV